MMKNQPKIEQSPLNSFDLLQSLASEINKGSKTGTSGSENTLIELLKDDPREYAVQCLVEFLRGLLNLNIDFKTCVLNVKIHENFDEKSQESVFAIVLHLVILKDSVIFVQKLRKVVQNYREDNLNSDKNLSDFCKEFIHNKRSSFMGEQTLYLQKMLKIFLKTIEDGLSAGNKEEAKRFQHIFFGKVRNEFIREFDDYELVKKEDGELEPVSLSKANEGFEVNLYHAFDTNKKSFMSSQVAFSLSNLSLKIFKGENFQEFTQTVWIVEPPEIVIFVFGNEEESEKFIELPRKIMLDAFLEKNAYKVKQYQKNQKDAWEVENKRIQQNIEENKKKADQRSMILSKLPDEESLEESILYKTDLENQLIDALKRYKNEKLPEINSSQIKFLPNQRKLPEDQCTEIFALQQVLINEGHKISLKTSEGYRNIETNTKSQPICAIYVKEPQRIKSGGLSSSFPVEEMKVEFVSSNNSLFFPNVNREKLSSIVSLNSNQRNIRDEYEEPNENENFEYEESNLQKNEKLKEGNASSIEMTVLKERIRRASRNIKRNSLARRLSRNNKQNCEGLSLDALESKCSDYFLHCLDFLSNHKYEILNADKIKIKKKFFNELGARILLQNNWGFEEFPQEQIIAGENFMREWNSIKHRPEINLKFKHYITILCNIKCSCQFAASKKLLEAICVLFGIDKNSCEANQTIFEASTCISWEFLYQIILLAGFGSVDKLIINSKETEALQYIEVISFFLSHTWRKLSKEHQDQINLCVTIIQNTIESKKLNKRTQDLLKRKISEIGKTHKLEANQSVKYLINGIKRDHSEEENFPDDQEILKGYSEFQKSLKHWIFFERTFNELSKDMLRKRKQMFQETGEIPLLEHLILFQVEE